MEVWDRSTAVNPSSPSDQAQCGPAPKPLFELWAPSHSGRLQLSSSGLLAVAALMGDVHVCNYYIALYMLTFSWGIICERLEKLGTVFRNVYQFYEKSTSSNYPDYTI